MRIDNDKSISPGGGDRIGDNCRPQGLTEGGASILARIAKLRYDRGYSRGAGATAGIQQQEQFDDVLVDRWRRRLYYVNIRAARPSDATPVGISRHLGVGFDAEMIRHRGTEAGIGPTADDP